MCVRVITLNLLDFVLSLKRYARDFLEPERVIPFLCLFFALYCCITAISADREGKGRE